MKRDILIGIDSGTSMVKAVAFDLSGQQLAIASTPNHYLQKSDGTATQPLQRTWEDCVSTVRALVERIPDLARRTVALAVTGQGDGTWLVGRDNTPVGDGWLWLDSRSASTVQHMRELDTDAMRFSATGTGLNSCQQCMQLAHMQSQTPDVLRRCEVAMHCKDWLYLNMTGERATDPSEACFTFGNFKTRHYDEAVIDSLGLTNLRSLLPPIVDGMETRHPLTEAAARQTGLLAGTPVCLGYVDVVCTALGAGLYSRSGSAGCSILGSTGMHMACVPDNEVQLNQQRTGYVMVLPVSGRVSQMQSNMSATLNIDWLLDMAADLLAELGLQSSRSDLLVNVDRWASNARAGSLIYHPYISEAGERGPFVNNDARASFIGLNTSHRFPDMLRSVMEGLGFAAADCYGAMGNVPNEIRLSGGAAQSAVLRTIVSAAVGTSVRYSARVEAGAAGAAMMAAVSLGVYDSMDNCVDEWVDPYLSELESPDSRLQGAVSITVSGLCLRTRGTGAYVEFYYQPAGDWIMKHRVAIIGDHFMLPEVFEQKLLEACEDLISIRTRKDDWPDTPMEHGYQGGQLEGLKEYFGTPDGVVEFVADAEILVTHLAPMSAEMFDRLPALKLIAVSRGGPVNIDMRAAHDHGVLIVNTPGRNASAVAEFTLGAILAETRKIRAGHEALRRGEWRGDLYRADTTGRELNEMTVGVIGYGNIGTRVVRLLLAFGCKVLVNDPYIQLPVSVAAQGVELVSLDRVLAESDVVTLHPRVTEETRQMINSETLAKMKPDALLVNTARGPLCDYDALYEALHSGRLAGAMLETFSIEPAPVDWPLLQLPNVTLTPHIAGASMRTVTFAAEQAAEEVHRYLAGEAPLNPC